MTDLDDTQPIVVARASRRGSFLISLGAGLVLLSVLGFLILSLIDDAGSPAVVEVTAVTATPAIALLPSPQPTSFAPTALPEPTRIPPPAFAGSTETLAPAAPAAQATAGQPAAPAPTLGVQPTISWTQAEIYALQWICYSEIGGMGSVKIDACYSVISTIRARYAYENSPFAERDVISTLMRPNQFHGTWYSDRPGPDADLNWAVEQYRLGARGSCNGYYFFDSVPGGPSLCVIYGAGGQFMEFHNGWN